MYGSFLYRMFNKHFSIERICIYVISIIIAIFAFVYFLAASVPLLSCLSRLFSWKKTPKKFVISPKFLIFAAVNLYH